MERGDILLRNFQFGIFLEELLFNFRKSQKNLAYVFNFRGLDQKSRFHLSSWMAGFDAHATGRLYCCLLAVPLLPLPELLLVARALYPAPHAVMAGELTMDGELNIRRLTLTS